jgi:histidinol-phosphate/aromatic aminotransferase/cobyric acid decarboxylase-like protein
LNFNSGSFGNVPSAVAAHQLQLLRDADTQPDVPPPRPPPPPLPRPSHTINQAWFRGRYQQLLSSARHALAAYIHAPPSDVVFVENASDGINAVLRSLPPPRRAKVMLLSTAYSMVKHTAAAFCQCVVTVDITFPVLSPREVIAAVLSDLKLHKPQLLIVIVPHLPSHHFAPSAAPALTINASPPPPLPQQHHLNSNSL